MRRAAEAKGRMDAFTKELNRMMFNHWLYNLSGQTEYPERPEIILKISFLQSETKKAAAELTEAILEVRDQISRIENDNERHKKEVLLSEVLRGK